MVAVTLQNTLASLVIMKCFLVGKCPTTTVPACLAGASGSRWLSWVLWCSYHAVVVMVHTQNLSSLKIKFSHSLYYFCLGTILWSIHILLLDLCMGVLWSIQVYYSGGPSVLGAWKWVCLSRHYFLCGSRGYQDYSILPYSESKLNGNREQEHPQPSHPFHLV